MPEVIVSIEAEGDAGAGAGLCGLTEVSLRHVVTLTLAEAGVEQSLELSVLVTDDETVRALNRDYRGRDTVTDVLSFPLLDTPLVTAPEDELWGAGDGDGDGNTTALHPGADQHEDESVLTSREQAGEHATVDDEDDGYVFVHPADAPPHLGDVVVARGMTTRQAAAAGHSPAYELAYLVAHGVLHLIGYDDHTDAGYAAMVRHQEAALAQAGIAR